MMTLVRLGSRLAAATLLCALAACSDEDTPAGRDSSSSAAGVPAHKVAWLEVHSSVTPAQWLASRDETTVRPAHDADVTRIAAQLSQAHKLYRESARMIANRAVQVSEMLKPLRVDESAPAILADLTAVADEAGKTEGFGAISQHYYNLRAARVERSEALAELRSRYGQKP